MFEGVKKQFICFWTFVIIIFDFKRTFCKMINPAVFHINYVYFRKFLSRQFIAKKNLSSFLFPELYLWIFARGFNDWFILSLETCSMISTASRFQLRHTHRSQFCRQKFSYFGEINLCYSMCIVSSEVATLLVAHTIAFWANYLILCCTYKAK